MARTVRFDAAHGRHVARHGSDFVMSRLFSSEDLHVSCVRLRRGGVMGLHQATAPQLFAAVGPEGWFRGREEDRTRIAAGEAVLWEEGEWHETGSDGGLVARHRVG